MVSMVLDTLEVTINLYSFVVLKLFDCALQNICLFLCHWLHRL